VDVSERELGGHAVTNYYVCPNEGWMWTLDSRSESSDRCPRCGLVVDPCASRANWGGVLNVLSEGDFERLRLADFGWPER